MQTSRAHEAERALARQVCRLYLVHTTRTMGQICVIGLSLSLLFLFCSSSETDIPVVCGGFIRSKFQADFTKIKVFMLAQSCISQIIKGTTEVSSFLFTFELYNH